MNDRFAINNACIGPQEPVYIIAEMSANHNKDFEKAVKIVEAAKMAGANAIKLQTYTQDTITIYCDNEYFQVKGATWGGQTLYDLYREAYTPWEWHPKLKKIADGIGLDFFSTPFDFSAIDFLERLNVPAYKVASFEVIDLPLLKKIAGTGKPIIVSTGMATLSEIDEALQILIKSGCDQLALLKCTSAYPAPYDEMNIKTIPHMAETFQLPVGLSDHTLGSAVAVAAVALGAQIVEKHLTLSRSDLGPDSSFSMEPHEFKQMVEDIRIAEKAIGRVQYQITEREKSSKVFRRSLFVVRDMRAGEKFTKQNVRSIRPAFGLHPRYIDKVFGRKAKKDILRGTPLSWDIIA